MQHKFTNIALACAAASLAFAQEGYTPLVSRNISYSERPYKVRDLNSDPKFMSSTNSPPILTRGRLTLMHLVAVLNTATTTAHPRLKGEPCFSTVAVVTVRLTRTP